jgi:hypothetical protein
MQIGNDEHCCSHFRPSIADEVWLPESQYTALLWLMGGTHLSICPELIHRKECEKADPG